MPRHKVSDSGTAAVLLMKLGPKLLKFLPKFLKLAKVGKFGSAGASYASWALMFSWQFALLIMLLLVVHESGHVWAMKRSKMATKGIYFVPFLGAAAVSEKAFPNRRTETFVAIMGPIWGFVLSVFVLGLWYLMGWSQFAAAAAWMATVNLFNLLPINPLDGGRIFKSVVFSVNTTLGLGFLILGLVCGLLLIMELHLWLFALLLIIGSLEFLWEWRHREKDRNMGRHGVFVSIGAYTLLVAALYLVMTLGAQVPGAGNPAHLFS